MSESVTATYEWHQLPWRKLEVAVFKLERRIYKASQAGESTWRWFIVTVMTRYTVDFTNSPNSSVLMTRVRSTEEPCAAKVARTVLKTSEGSDLLAEFNRAHRFGVMWRKRSQGTRSEKGNRWVERVLSLRHTCRIRGRPTFPILVDAVSCLFKGTKPDLSWLTQHEFLPVPSTP
jgi:hypothetical protein